MDTWQDNRQSLLHSLQNWSLSPTNRRLNARAELLNPLRKNARVWSQPQRNSILSFTLARRREAQFILCQTGNRKEIVSFLLFLPRVGKRCNLFCVESAQKDARKFFFFFWLKLHLQVRRTPMWVKLPTFFAFFSPRKMYFLFHQSDHSIILNLTGTVNGEKKKKEHKFLSNLLKD